LVTALDVPADLLIKRVAERLKREYEQVKPPAWAFYVKTGVKRIEDVDLKERKFVEQALKVVAA